MTVSSAPNLFKPLKVGRLTLQNRIALAPLTRFRADNPPTIPNDLMVKYYEQRSSTPGTLLISEATFITERAGGYRNVPGIWSKAQIEGWKKVTESVHKNGSFIYLQLWALGCAAHSNYLKELGHDFVSSSNIRDVTRKSTIDPRPLTLTEIKEYIDEYAVAAKNAIEAGFDGVEIHSANGYLLDQFLRDLANKRTDQYGGSVENRARFTLDVVDAISGAIGADRTAIRLSPFNTYAGIKPTVNTVPQYSYVVEQLEKRGLEDPSKRLAYIHLIDHVVESTDGDGKKVTSYPIDLFKYIWSGNWIRTQGYDRESALAKAQGDNNLLIGFGKAFISNPDLVRRLKEDLPLNDFNQDTFYTQGPVGYTDYPFHK